MIVRVRYAKLGKVRFTSHRDTARIWERALRRAGVPVAVSGGFTPRPRISFGLALPTGAESVAEYLDVEVVDGSLAHEDVAGLAGRIDPLLPVGFATLAVVEPEPAAGSLQSSVTAVTWELSTPTGVDVAAAVRRVLEADALPLARERKGSACVDDVRPAIRSLAVNGDGTLVAELATVRRGLRPTELGAVTFPGADVTALRALRTHQWIEHDGHRREVVALPDAVPATPVGV